MFNARIYQYPQVASVEILQSFNIKVGGTYSNHGALKL
jgi:hypothetical protein